MSILLSAKGNATYRERRPNYGKIAQTFLLTVFSRMAVKDLPLVSVAGLEDARGLIVVWDWDVRVAVSGGEKAMPLVETTVALRSGSGRAIATTSQGLMAISDAGSLESFMYAEVFLPGHLYGTAFKDHSLTRPPFQDGEVIRKEGHGLPTLGLIAIRRPLRSTSIEKAVLFVSPVRVFSEQHLGRALYKAVSPKRQVSDFKIDAEMRSIAPRCDVTLYRLADYCEKDDGKTRPPGGNRRRWEIAGSQHCGHNPFEVMSERTALTRPMFPA